jgi:beta-hydroxyacyl-ACP dehydratase FabZ
MELSIRDVLRYLPHRYPFLLVDRVVDLDVDAGRIIALKNVTINEEFFTGHLPGRPVMPGVLIIEALAQTAGILALHKLGQRGRLAYFAAVDGFRFRRIVTPGDRLHLEVTLDWIRGRLIRVQGRARVDGQLAAEGTLTFSVSNEEDGR